MSTVIKAGQTGKLLRHLSTMDLADHLAEAHDVIEAARNEAQRIVREAKEERARLLAEARREGYDEGYRLGQESGEKAGRETAFVEATERFDAQHTNVVADARRVIAQFDEMKEGIRLAARQDLLEFGVALATKLTFAIGRAHPESAAANLERAIRLIGAKTDVTVRIHPDDVESIRKAAKPLLDQLEQSASVTLAPDETVSPGGCSLHTEATDVDARLETQIEELVAVIVGRKEKA